MDEYIFPRNKVLRQEFLVKLLKSFRDIGDGKTEDDIVKINDWNLKSQSLKFYNYYLKQRPIIVYNGENFHILSIHISDHSFGSRYVEKTYKDIWNENDKNNEAAYNLMLQGLCVCEESRSNSDTEDEHYNLYSFKKLLAVMNEEDKSYQGSYFSQPASYTSISGSQFNWSMIFNYKSSLNINVELGPGPRTIINKCIIGFAGQPLDFIIKSNENELINDYRPSNLFFEDDFLPILKELLSSNNNSPFVYKNYTYKLIDYRFSTIVSGMFSCGCVYSYTFPLDNETGIGEIPDKQRYGLYFITSCTPEWYIQVQLGQANSGNYLGRFIIKLLE